MNHVDAIRDSDRHEHHRQGGIEGGEDDDPEPEESGELEDLDFESCAGLWKNRGVLLQVVLDKTMPPGAWPRLDDREVELIKRWVFTTFECPCEEECP